MDVQAASDRSAATGQLDAPGWEASAIARQVDRATWFCVALGVLLRVWRYAMDHPLWGDEAFVAASLIDRDYLGLLRPLEYHQIAPPLFLWGELAMVKTLGFNAWALRLLPVIYGALSVVLFRHVAARLLRGVPLLLAVATFAVAFYPVRHATEVKPYASDLLVAVGLIALAVEWMRDRHAVGWLWGLAAAMPLALGASHPAVFVAGGIAAALALPVWREGRWRTRLAYAAFVAAMCASFLAMFLLVTSGQSEHAGAGTRDYWANAFPPSLTRPLALLLWLVQAHTSHMFSYPVGGANGASTLTTALALVGGLALWRTGRRETLALLLAPFALGLAAAALGKYPYGGSARTMQYVAPAICILAGLGAGRLLGRLRRPAARERWLRLALGCLALIAVVETGRDTLFRYKVVEDRLARDFARWFWPAQEGEAVVACVHRDLGRTFDPEHWDIGRTAVYQCNQRIYSPRQKGGRPVAWGSISGERPVRCVLYNEDPSDPAVAAWLDEMQRHFTLRGVAQYAPVPKVILAGQPFEDRYLVYEFTPRPGTDPVAALQPNTSRR